MPQSGRVVSTEIQGFDLCLQATELSLTRSGENIIPPIMLGQIDAERLRLEMAKAQLWEWNQFAAAKCRAEKRRARYLQSWLLMGLAALAAYFGHSRYWVALLLALISVGIWRWAAFREGQGTRAAREERQNFFPDWTYLRRRFDESPMVVVVGPYPPAGVG